MVSRLRRPPDQPELVLAQTPMNRFRGPGALQFAGPLEPQRSGRSGKDGGFG